MTEVGPQFSLTEFLASKTPDENRRGIEEYDSGVRRGHIEGCDFCRPRYGSESPRRILGGSDESARRSLMETDC